MSQVFKKLFWTEHSKIKMKQYGLSKQKLLGILYKPDRKEQGIVPGTTAVMRTNKKFGSKTVLIFEDKKEGNSLKVRTFKRVRAPGEIWLMYKDAKDIRKIISAWRYPGISKPGEEIPIPKDIRQELLDQLNNFK